MQNPVIRRLTALNDLAIPAVRRIYESELPASERKPTAAIDQMLQRSDYAVLVIEDRNSTIGFAILFMPENPADAALLEYLAIDANHQGLGAGTVLVQFAIGLAATRPLLIEVESSDEINAQRRRTFYHRLGFRKLNGLSYLLPLPNAPPMELMVINAPAGISHGTLARWLTNIYESVYSCRRDDPRLIKMLDAKFSVE